MPATSPQRLLQSVSLDALRGFEAAARLASFTAAADELCLTQSAVSKQVRQLEDTLGRALFVRGSRSLTLTADGRTLFDGVHAALHALETALSAAADAPRSIISLTAPPAFASLWLAPRLARFRETAPGIGVRLDAFEGRRDLQREGYDLAIRLSAPDAAPASWTPLLNEQLVLVAAPALAARVSSPDDLRAIPLLEFEHPVSRHRWMKWVDWLTHWNLPTHDRRQPVYHFSQYEHALKAAAEGTGAAIGRRPLVDRLLEEGQLQTVLPEMCADGLGYYLVQSDAGRAHPEAQQLAGWIAGELQQNSNR